MLSYNPKCLLKCKNHMRYLHCSFCIYYLINFSSIVNLVLNDLLSIVSCYLFFMIPLSSFWIMTLFIIFLLFLEIIRFISLQVCRAIHPKWILQRITYRFFSSTNTFLTYLLPTQQRFQKKKVTWYLQYLSYIIFRPKPSFVLIWLFLILVTQIIFSLN